MRIIGHGVDLVSIARIARMVGDHSDRFLERCFTQAEREYNAGSKRYHEHLAARFAAKEAVMKALGTGLSDGISWTDIETVNQPSGQPRLNLRGVALDVATRRGIDLWLVSLSHTEEHALASVLGLGSE